MASQKDYYDILGVRRGATEEEIEKAYQKLARTYYFDPHGGNKTAEIRFREISEAYEILSNKEKRERYDRLGLEVSSPNFCWEYGPEEGEKEKPDFTGFEDIFGRSFISSEGRASQPQKGRDLHCTVEIGLGKTIQGLVQEVQVQRENPCPGCGGRGVDPAGLKKVCDECGGAGQVQIGLAPAAFLQTCARCHGRGKIQIQLCASCSGKGRLTQRASVYLAIPSGVADGCRIYLKRMGQAGKNGGPRGDLVVNIQVKKHPLFHRIGDDLHLEVPLAFWEAALGAEVEVPTLEGRMILTIPPGVQNGERMRLQGKGVPHLHGDGRGDQVISFKIVVPRDWDERAKEILGELKRLNPENPRQGWRWHD